MPITYSIDPALDLLVLLAEGTVTDDELWAVVQASSADPRYHPEIRMLADCTKMTRDGMSVKGIERLAAAIRPSPKSRRAVLVNDKMHFGMVRMYAGYCESHHVSYPLPFYSREKALAYLNQGVPPEKFIR